MYEDVVKDAATRFIPVKVDMSMYTNPSGEPQVELYEIKDRISFNKIMLSGETLKGFKEAIIDVCNAMNGKSAYHINYNLEYEE